MQAPPAAFMPRSSPAQTPSYGQQPSPFGQAVQSGPITPPKPAPPPAPTGPPATANVTNVDTSKVSVTILRPPWSYLNAPFPLGLQA